MWCRVQKCRPWVRVPFAQGACVFKNRFSLGIHVHTPCTHSRFIYFKHVHEETNMESKTNKVQFFITKVMFGSYNLVLPLRRYNKTKNVQSFR